MIRVHELGGCAPAPLAHYLKALGVLRLVAKQADEDARGWWEGDRFRLATALTREALERFFLHKYAPTPLVSPWNKGAGFFKDDPGIASIEHSRANRFISFRRAVDESRIRLNKLSTADKAVRDIKALAKQPGMSAVERDRIRNSEGYKANLREAERRFMQLKESAIPDLRSSWRGPHREWLDAAMVLADDGKPKYPALLGSGGNDGRLDFTNSFMKRLGDLYMLDSDDAGPKPEARAWFSGALWGEPAPSSVRRQPVGQYLPGTAGGANNGNGPESAGVVNPADFVLMLEGTITVTSQASRRFGSLGTSRAASPFAMDAVGAGYASASPEDEGARGEQWFPVWTRPSTYVELRRLFADGRAQLGARQASTSLDMARAVGSLGISRGVKTFQRYGYIERNGQSKLAVPLGRFDVADQNAGNLACIGDLDVWLRRFRREARGRHASARLLSMEKALTDALFAVVERPSDPARWQQVLSRLAEAEGFVAYGNASRLRPLPALRPEWVLASDDGMPELRLAVTFALQQPADPIRRHWLPLDKSGRRSEVVMHGRCGLDDAVALLERRLTEASQQESRHLALTASHGAAARVADLADLIAGGVDMDRTLALARSLMALERRKWAQNPALLDGPFSSDWPDDAWLAIRLCMLPWPLETPSGFRLDVGADPAIVRRLSAGDAASAVDIALRRLQAAGVRCTVRMAAASADAARRWAAALAFPITKRTARRFLSRLDPNEELA